MQGEHRSDVQLTKKHSICRPHGKATIVVLFPSWQKFMICNINCQNHTGFSLFVLVILCKYVFVVWMYWKLGFHCNCTCFDAFLSSIFFTFCSHYLHIFEYPCLTLKEKNIFSDWTPTAPTPEVETNQAETETTRLEVDTTLTFQATNTNGVTQGEWSYMEHKSPPSIGSHCFFLSYCSLR